MAALRWCRQHNASIRFESNGTVTIKVNDVRRRRATLVEACEDLDAKLSGMPTR